MFLFMYAVCIITNTHPSIIWSFWQNCVANQIITITVTSFQSVLLEFVAIGMLDR